MQEKKDRSLSIRAKLVLWGIGTRKFSYDLWGDTVNIARRMESHGVTGCIHVSRTTYELLKDKFKFQERGSVAVKGKGEMTTYLLQ